jgi:hypothetical protein
VAKVRRIPLGFRLLRHVEGGRNGNEFDWWMKSRYFEDDRAVTSVGRQSGVAVVASSNKSVGLVDFARSITASSGGERERSSLTSEVGRNRGHMNVPPTSHSICASNLADIDDT